MKKLLIATLSVCLCCMAVVLCSCGKNEAPTDPPISPATTAAGEGLLTDGRQETTTEKTETLTPQCVADYIGMRKEDAVASLGNGYTIEYNVGSYGLTYVERNLWLGFTPPLINALENEITDDMHIGYAYFDLKSGKIIFDVQPGMTYEEVVESGQLPNLSEAEFSEFRDINVASATIEYNGHMLYLVLYFDPESSILSSGGIVLKEEESSEKTNIHNETGENNYV